MIVATEMLDNMIKSPYPTKAEILDISNSIIDGTAATMLSGETAIGDYPVEAIKVMSQVARSTIKHQDHTNLKGDNSSNIVADGTALAINNLCRYLPITKIIAITLSGFAARAIASQMLPQPILAVSNNKDIVRGFNLYSGTKGIFLIQNFIKTI